MTASPDTLAAARAEATHVVHTGLADILRWLGEEPVTDYRPRHSGGMTTVRIDPRGTVAWTWETP